MKCPAHFQNFHTCKVKLTFFYNQPFRFTSIKQNVTNLIIYFKIIFFFKILSAFHIKRKKKFVISVITFIVHTYSSMYQCTYILLKLRFDNLYEFWKTQDIFIHMSLCIQFFLFFLGSRTTNYCPSHHFALRVFFFFFK